MGIPTLISTATSSNVASVSITSGIDSTYDEYMFVLTDINPATDEVNLTFQFNATDSTSYDETITSTFFNAFNNEAGSSTSIAYSTGNDQAQGTAYQPLSLGIGNGSDESCAGILHLFSPASTTYVKHFYTRVHRYYAGNFAIVDYAAGYINTTTAIDDIQFKMSSGNFDGVIQMYGIA
jgi:hypothetical protein